MEISKKTLNQVLTAQKSEITEYHIYNKLAKNTKDEENTKVLHKIADEEKAHAKRWQKYTGKDVKPNRWKIFKFYWISKIFGLTFGIKLMEKGENEAQVNYNEISKQIPEALEIASDEERHEAELIKMIDEEKLKYVGSMVLGLNDALVEMTGALAGFTFALQRGSLIAVLGLITGISATLSMAASEYLSTRAEEDDKDDDDVSAGKAAVYTGIAYLITVSLLILPFFLISNVFISLGVMLAIVVLIIFVFNFYIAVAKDLNFKKRFFEMALVSIGVAALSFVIGYIVKTYFGLEV